jgi:hypothetical protein
MHSEVKTPTTHKFRESRPVAFRDHIIRLVDIDGATWLCKTDIEKAIDATFKIDDSYWSRGGVVMANINGAYDITAYPGSNGHTSMLCISFEVAKSMSARSMAPNEDVEALWNWIDHQGPKWEAQGEAELHRRKMSLYNQFHHVRRFANSVEFNEARMHALSWIELLDKIDECTTLDERFELCGTNIADRKDMIETAKKYGTRLTMHAILSVWKGGHSATYRTPSGTGFHGEQLGLHLSWFTTMDRKDLNPMAQFFDLKDAFPEAQRPTPGELAAQFEDLMEKRAALVQLSRQNQRKAAEGGIRNAAALYGVAGSLHAHVLSIWREAAADGSLEAIEAALAKGEPFCEEATETEREIIKILNSDAEDAAPRVLH